MKEATINVIKDEGFILTTNPVKTANEIDFYIDAAKLKDFLYKEIPAKTTFLALKNFLSIVKFPINYREELLDILNHRI